MEKRSLGQWFRLLAGPALTILPGLVLLFTPDTASVLIGQLLGWCCLLAAAAQVAGIIFGAPARRNHHIAWTVICAAAGIWMLRNPLTVAEFLGRVLGIALIVRGAQSAADKLRCSGKRPRITRDLILSAVTMAGGALLVILPMASSRLLFHVIGIGLICLGSAQALDRIRSRELPESCDDSNIIDVEKL